MTEVIVVFNAGSSSLKYAVFRRDDLGLIHKGIAEVADSEGGHEAALAEALDWISAHKDGLRLTAAGHRVVHGKDRDAPALIMPDLMAELKGLIPLAPLHQPHNLRIIEALSVLHPALPQVACFDTAFHRTQPRLATMLALPRRFYGAGVKRYGFHGISYEHTASVLPELAGEKAEGRVIAAHLGSGASLCAMKGGKSVATSMGFSTLDGLMMGTRCGALDAGALLYLQQHLGMSAAEAADMLYRESGLLGVSGISADMRALEQSPASAAKEAIDLFCRMAAGAMGGLMAVLGGLDALVFTGGIGEHSARVRRGICDYFGWMGLALDEERNRENAPLIHKAGSVISVHMIPANEELVVARACHKMMQP